MFQGEFYPTPHEVIEAITQHLPIQGKVFLEPQGGKGDIVDYLNDNGAKQVISCEINKDLQKILATKCKIIADDFLTVKSEQVSHIDCIIMNPPFSNGTKHFLHAYDIAPAGCEIICLLNASNLSNTHTTERQRVKGLVDSLGFWANLGDCFSDAERKTGVEVAFISIKKEGENKNSEFEGFFMDEDPQEQQENGLMSYNVVRDLVNRYVAAVKLFDEQLATGLKMHNLLDSFYGSELAFTCTNKSGEVKKEEFKKDLQKAGWKFIFEKMNLTRFTTKGVRDDINKFVEQQTNIPFTMKNIYKMLDIVIGTASQRMDKALLEVFERVTERHHDNRHNVQGWKTNLHYLVGKKFILPYMINPAKEYGYTSDSYNSLRNSYDGIIPDFEKALCYISGDKYVEKEWSSSKGQWEYTGILTVNSSINRNAYGEWYESHFFRYKGYKNGNMHFEFKDLNLWGRFNQKIAELKGFPLFDAQQQTKYQKRNAGKAA